MKQLKYYKAYILKILQRYSKMLLLSVVVLLVGLIVLAKIVVSSYQPVIIEGMVGTYTEDSMPTQITNLLSQGLVSLDSSGKPVADLAAGWQTNKDATEYTFKLKNNLYWSDGTPIKAQDLDVAVPEADTSVVDNQTLDFKLNDSFSPFPNLLTKPLFKSGTFTGVGPYKLSSIETTTVFIEKVTLTPLKDNLPTVIIKFYPSDEVAKEALERGDVQSIVGVNDVSAFANQSPYTVLDRTNYSRIVTIFYNTADKTLSDRNLRLALSFAAPEIKGEKTAVTSLPPTSWAFNPDVRDYLDNPDQAKLYLNKVKESSTSASLVLTSTTSLGDIGKQVVDAWNKMGISASLRVESGLPQNFQALLISQDIPLDPDQYSLWHSTQSDTNISKISSPRIDQDLEDGRKNTDMSVRKSKYQDFQKVLLDEAPATFLYFPKFEVVTLKKDQSDLEKVLKIQFPNLGF